MAKRWPFGRSTWIGALLVAIWLVGREVLSEFAFGSSGVWLEENTWLVGDFLAWQPMSTIIVGIGLVIVTAAIITSFSQKEETVPATDGNDGQPRIDVKSYNQQGGITAGVVNIQGESQPKISLSNESYNKTKEGHVYEADLNIETQFVIPSLKVSAFAKSIQEFDVVPQRGGLHMTGNAGKREDHHFTTLQNAAGLYRVKAVTSEPEQVQIDLSQ